MSEKKRAFQKEGSYISELQPHSQYLVSFFLCVSYCICLGLLPKYKYVPWEGIMIL